MLAKRPRNSFQLAVFDNYTLIVWTKKMYLVLAVISLGVLVFIHELGHFFAARVCKVKVKEFSIGMGPVLIQKRAMKGTVYSLRVLPIGGFCSFYSKEDGEVEKAALFDHQPIWKRFVIVLAGPLMNLGLAILIIAVYLMSIGLNTVVPTIGDLAPSAFNAGLRMGDTIIGINGVSMNNVQEISDAIAKTDGIPLSIEVSREQHKLSFRVTPFYDAQAGRWRAGIVFEQMKKAMSVRDSIVLSFRYNMQNALLILKTLKGLFTEHRGFENLTGPIGTVYYVMDETRRGGAGLYIELLALISVNLAVFNLLPIPGLDGSRLLFLIYEAIRHKPVREEVESFIYFLGFSVILLLIVVLSYKDIWSLVTHRFN